MSDHDAEHDERVLRVAFDGAAATGEVLAALARCDDCLTRLARAVEDAIVMGPAGGARAARLAAILDEALVWRVVVEDVGGGGTPGPGVGVGAGAVRRKGD